MTNTTRPSADPARMAHLRLEAMQELSRRALPAAYIYPLFIAVIGFTTDYAIAHAAMFWTMSTLFVLVSAFRIGIHKASKKCWAGSSPAWPNLMTACTLTSGAFWGLLLAHTVWKYGSSAWTT